jgi:hypothetical protein
VKPALRVFTVHLDEGEDEVPFLIDVGISFQVNSTVVTPSPGAYWFTRHILKQAV